MGIAPNWQPGILYEWRPGSRWSGRVRHVDGLPLEHDWWVDQADLMPREEGKLNFSGDG